MVRVCDDGADDWTSGGGDVTSVAECEQKCSGYKYMALVKCRCFLDLIALAGKEKGDEHCRHARATTHLSAGAATSSTRTTWARSACLTRNAAATPATRPAWRRTATAPASQHRVSFSREGSCLVGLAVPRCSAPRSQLSGKQQLPLRLLAEVSKTLPAAQDVQRREEEWRRDQHRLWRIVLALLHASHQRRLPGLLPRRRNAARRPIPGPSLR